MSTHVRIHGYGAEDGRLIRATNLYEKVYDQLKREIYDGAFPADRAVLEAELAGRLGVSRTPVREALRILASEGLVEPATGGGVCALPIGTRDIRDAVEVRLAVEPVAARLAAERISETQVTALEAIVGRARDALQAGLLGETMAANEAFHFAVAEATGSRLMVFLLGRTYETIRVSRVLDGVRAQRAAFDAMRVFVAEHEAVAAAIGRRDGAEAARLMHDHLDRLGDWYQSSLALVRDVRRRHPDAHAGAAPARPE